MPSACSRFYSGILIIVLCNPSEDQYFCTPAFSSVASRESAKDGDKEKEEIVKGSHHSVTLLNTVSHQMCIRLP